jgi:F-type H+-transporting ATPase subunit epsilon
MAELTVSLVSADKAIWSGGARQVVARTTEGEIGILPGHVPILALLAPGEVRVTTPDGAVVSANTSEGFFSVERDNVTIVANTASLVSK